MGKLFLYGLTILLFFGCKEKQVEVPLAASTEDQFEIEKLPKRTIVSGKALAILKDWSEYNDLDASFDALYKAENKEDLILIVEDLVEKQKLLAEGDYPDDFDKPQIKGRQKVLKTYILKVKAALENRIGVDEPVGEMIESYNALRNQFKVTVNNTIDTDLIFDE